MSQLVPQTRKVKDMWCTYCRRENGVRQGQSLQVCHKAVGQEGVDGCDLRRGSRFDWEKWSWCETHSTSVSPNLNCNNMFVILSHVLQQPCPLTLPHWDKHHYFCILSQEQKVYRGVKKKLTIIEVEQRHFFLLFLALFLDRLRRRFWFSCLEGDERKLTWINEHFHVTAWSRNTGMLEWMTLF